MPPPLQRTFVASYGLDPVVPGDHSTRPCNLPLPCRTFNAAIGNVIGGGEIVILDTAGYGPFTINKSVKVIGPSGVYGGISVQGAGTGLTTGIVINAGDTDVVTLRGLDIAGVPGAAPLPRTASTSRTRAQSTSRSRRSATSRRTRAPASISPRTQSTDVSSTTVSCANAGPASSRPAPTTMLRSASTTHGSRRVWARSPPASTCRGRWTCRCATARFH